MTADGPSDHGRPGGGAGMSGNGEGGSGGGSEPASLGRASGTGPEAPRDGPLRFCMITTFYPPYNFGGDGIAVQRLSRALVGRGHHVEVVHDVDAWRLLADGPEPDPAGDGDDGVVVHRLESGLGPFSPLLTQQTGHPVANGGRIREILQEGRFDVINFHNVSLVGGPGVLALGDAAKLYTAHEHWLVCPTHVLWRHDREPCTGRECLRCQLHHRRPPQTWRHTGLVERMAAHVDTFVARSDFSRRKHRDFGFSREMEVLPYFLPAHETTESEDGDAPVGGAGAGSAGGSAVADDPAPHPSPYFLFVGRLEKIKGLQDVLPVFAEPGGPDLLVAGDGEYGEELRSRAAGSPRVHFLGRVPQDRLRRYYRGALGVLVPSVGYETFGIVIIESFREGTPVIARRRGPFPEILERSGAGHLFDDREELVTALERLASDPDHRRELGRRGAEAFLEHWSEEAVVPRYLELARSAIRERGPGIDRGRERAIPVTEARE